MQKRLFDLVISILSLVLLSPLIFIIMIIIKLDSSGPVFFRQQRVGRGGLIFNIHKFRTMYINSENAGRLTIGSDKRITDFGVFLRKSKLDELPQLVDVALGKMSLVGPRPEVPEFIDEYPEKVKDIILSIRPGITDIASIEMIDENKILSDYADPTTAYINIILPKKQAHYMQYVKNQSFFYDIKIIFMTLIKLFRR